MKRISLLIAVVIILSSLGVISTTGCTKQENKKLTVVTGTSLVTCIVEQIGGDRINVVNLLSPTQHPGNYDAKPSDIEKLANADIFLLQGLPGETYVDKLVTSADNPKLNVIKASVDGNWMIPSVQMLAVEKIANILGQADTKNASYYSESAATYKWQIQTAEVKINTMLTNAGVSQINAIASVRQADFLKWTGINVVATFGAVNTLTPQVMQQLVDAGKQGNVTLIVNNLQDGPDAGKGIAEELGARSINLSNFPGGYPDTETWEKAINYNVELITGAVSK